MSTLSDISIPDIPPLSPGSSVSTRLQDEYDELLKFAVVVPKYDPRGIHQTLTDTRESFLQKDLSARSQDMLLLDVPKYNNAESREDDECSEATDVTPINVRSSQDILPDFGGHSPIRTEQNNSGQSSRYRDLPSYDSKREKPPAPSIQRERDFEIEQGEYERVYTATVDPDVAKMETMMDQWCLDLKRNVLAEFSQSKIKIVEQGRHQLVKEQEKHASEKMKMLEEMNGLKELLATYEKSIERKDQVISNLTHAMQKQREKMDMTRKFCEWKIRHNDYKREAFTSKLAKEHYYRRLSRKAWDAWHSIIEAKWRQRVEKACQSKAQEVCLQLTGEYEAKLREANEGLGAAQADVANMHKDRERHEEMMKKAFMRGVCALNLEAMTIFHGEEKENQGENENKNANVSDNLMGSLPEKDYSIPKSLPHDQFSGVINKNADVSDNLMGSLPEKDYSVPKSLPHDQFSGVSVQRHERIITSEGSRSTSVTQTKPQNTRPKSNKKVLTTKVSAKVDSGKSKSHEIQSVAPPMSSVIVERHQPVTKQTMPHAIAEKYSIPGRVQSGGAAAHRKIAGQKGLPLTTNVQTVKHVE